MNILGLTSKLHQMQTNRASFIIQKEAITSNYFKSGTVLFTIDTEDFNSKGSCNSIPFDKDLLAVYLQAEINNIDIESKEILKKLSEDKDLI